MKYFYDNRNRLICTPYSITNLTVAAHDLGISTIWISEGVIFIPPAIQAKVKEKAKFVPPHKITGVLNKWQEKNQKKT